MHQLIEVGKGGGGWFVRRTEYTQSGNSRFLAYIPSWKISPGWWGGGICIHTPIHSVNHHIQSCSVSSSLEVRYTPISSLPLFTLFWGRYESVQCTCARVEILYSLLCVRFMSISMYRSQPKAKFMNIQNFVEFSGHILENSQTYRYTMFTLQTSLKKGGGSNLLAEMNVNTPQRQNAENLKQIFPRKGISGSQSKFLSCVCERYIYSHDGPAYFAAGNMWTAPWTI